MEQILAAQLDRVPDLLDGYEIRVFNQGAVEDTQPELHACNTVVFERDFVAVGFLETAVQKPLPVIVAGDVEQGLAGDFEACCAEWWVSAIGVVCCVVVFYDIEDEIAGGVDLFERLGLWDVRRFDGVVGGELTWKLAIVRCVVSE